MTVIGQKTLWEGKYIKTSLIYYRDRYGAEREWEAVSRINCGGVVIVVPFTEDREILLIRQFRPVLNNYVIEFPAGLIDDGEDPISAGRRELIEETGHSSDDFALLSGGVMSTGIDTDNWTIVLARDVRNVSEKIREAHPPDESEEIETIKVSFGSVYEVLETYRNNGDEIDLRIYGLLEFAKRKMNTV